MPFPFPIPQRTPLLRSPLCEEIWIHSATIEWVFFHLPWLPAFTFFFFFWFFLLSYFLFPSTLTFDLRRTASSFLYEFPRSRSFSPSPFIRLLLLGRPDLRLLLFLSSRGGKVPPSPPSSSWYDSNPTTLIFGSFSAAFLHAHNTHARQVAQSTEIEFHFRTCQWYRNNCTFPSCWNCSCPPLFRHDPNAGGMPNLRHCCPS